MMGTVWFFFLMLLFGAVASVASANVIHLVIGIRSSIAFVGYLVMQIGLWHTERKWDEEGSAAWLEVAGGDESQPPEMLEQKFGTRKGERDDSILLLEGGATEKVIIPEEKLNAAFPIPWGFLVGWWLWGASYLFPMNGSINFAPTKFGIAACVISVFISFDASLPMADAVKNLLKEKKKMLSLLFVIGWISLGVTSALDVTEQLQAYGFDGPTKALTWILCMLGPITIIMSQQILFSARKMGTFWEQSGIPNFHPIVYNMGGPLFVFGWFMLWLGTSGIAGEADAGNIYGNMPTTSPCLPLFLNGRTLVSFMCGCGMVPVVRFFDYSHDEDGPWLGANNEGQVFKKWWLGTDGTYFGVFLESPWPFLIFWTGYGLSSWVTFDNQIEVGVREIIISVISILQGIDAGILIQHNLYAGNAEGKNFFSIPFVLLFLTLAVTIGMHWQWRAVAFSLPGAALIVMGQKTVFGDRKRGDYSMQNNGKANPYDKVIVYSWGEVFFMMGWILICWGMAMPE